MAEDRFAAVPATVAARRMRKRLRRELAQAISDYNMVQDGDLLMVCLSGGKDSHTLLDLLLDWRRLAPLRFELVVVNLDQGHPGFPAGTLPAYLERRGLPFHVLRRDTHSIVRRLIPPDKTACSLCSRLRRGILYDFAQQLGATKVVLGHHRDDMIETLFLNLFFNGRLKSMPPKLLSDDRRNVLIRPLAYCCEADILTWSRLRGFPIVPCTLCGNDDHGQRQKIKAMLQEWERQSPGRLASIAAGLRRVSPSQLADPELFDFASLHPEPAPALPPPRIVPLAAPSGLLASDG